MVYLKLWLPLDENKGGLILRKDLVTLDLVETRHKSIWLSNNTIRNPAIFFIFFDIFLLLRSNKEVTTENLSLNKWKTSPAEISEDCKKCEKKTSRDSGNSRFGGDETQIDPASEQHNPKPYKFLFFWYFSFTRSTKDCEKYKKNFTW